MNPLRPIPFHPFSTILLAAACATVSACQPAGDDDAANEPDAANEAMFNLPAVPLPEPPMDRAALLTAVARAASATASGADDAADQRSLDGKRFELSIRFGCRGPAPDLREAVFGWTFNREDRTLRLRATPTISGESELIKQIAGEDFEAVEGFWVPRPWLLEPVCPAAAAVRPAPQAAPSEPESEPESEPQAAAADREQSPAPVDDEQESQAPPPARPRVGIAQFFRDTDPRTGRRDMRPYETLKTLEPNQSLGSQGFNLVLSGRLRAIPGKGVIACVPLGSDRPPECVVSADFDRVRMERPDNREVLAEWTSG